MEEEEEVAKETEVTKRSRSGSDLAGTKTKSKKKIKKEEDGEEPEEEDVDDIEDLVPSSEKKSLNHFESFHHFSDQEKKDLTPQLLGWYDINRRSLPWRAEPGAAITEDRGYAVWVSEIMLQQTRVATVIEYYKQWMKKWPTIESLANATLDEVNEMWKGLGYYRRARFLHEGAKEVVAKHNGKLPQTAEKLAKLPGIGKYTAGAIASIAYGQPTPVVDGNVIRVISRLRAVDADPKNKSAVELMWRLADELVQAAHAQRTSCAGDFNQALMELGATVCTPLAPQCSKCPISSQCKAFQMAKPNDLKFDSKSKSTASSSTKLESSTTETKQKLCSVCEEDPRTRVESVMVFPRKAKKNAQREETIAVALVEAQGPTYLITQRPATGLLASLWEFPSVKIDDDATSKDAIDEYLQTYGIGADYLKGATRKPLGETLHLFTHIRQRAVVESIVLSADVTHHQLTKEMDQHRAKNSLLAFKWVNREELESAAVSTGMKKAFDLLSAKKKAQSSKALMSNATCVTSKPSSGQQKSIMSFFKKV